MIEASCRLVRPNSGPCSQIKKLFASYAADMKKAAVNDLRRDRQPSGRLRKANDNSLRQDEPLAGIEGELDISIVEDGSFRMAVGDELSDDGHDKHLVGVRADGVCNCAGRDLNGSKPVWFRLGAGH
jgi:hypothetical protein